MNVLTIVLQVLGILILIPAVAIATLRLDNQNADGPSILFPGGELVSGELYTGLRLGARKPSPSLALINKVSIGR